MTLIGSVGNLGATGNTFGLHFLGAELAPLLEKRFGAEHVVIDVFGGGMPSHEVARVLSRPSIRLRGWVDDIASEIQDSCAFLVLTNVNGFLVGNTRVLLAWSLGACVIAHSDSALSMPEVEHGKNALLGSSAEELASAIAQAVTDDSLRKSIGQGGYNTYQEFYRSDVVVPKMLSAIKACVDAGEHARGQERMC